MTRDPVVGFRHLERLSLERRSRPRGGDIRFERDQRLTLDHRVPGHQTAVAQQQGKQRSNECFHDRSEAAISHDSGVL